MPINRIRKGGNAEKDVAKLMEAWTKKKFKRAETNTFIHNRTAQNSKGDIVCCTEGHYFSLCVEVKFYKEINFEHLLYLPEPLIKKFWTQVTNDGKLCKKIPILFMRYNGLPKNFFFVGLEVYIYETYFIPYIDEPKSLYCYNLNLVLIPSTDFFKAPYKEIKKSLRNHIKNNL